ncbi:LytTR family transcriptional regulator DNA-binding domain-containing protein [Paenibacillus daejeonensis]|uniref:LytTR family transcriptional regulator DNA-binding domain-containing protein n=1 Tax=Paenibacillus daejeonensis TaxID=135193 RepID=UPI000379385A|nr:LytTR family transcriptional regulator DNA-binding domain-containing protein [Paenibacillus daejeonensis]
MKIPVTRDKHNDTDVVMLDVADILYIQTEEGVLVFHSEKDHFYPLVPSLSAYLRHLGPMGFRKLDRINLVNSSKIKAYDHELGKVYFGPHDLPRVKSATIAFMHKVKLRQEIESWIARNIKNDEGPL